MHATSINNKRLLGGIPPSIVWVLQAIAPRQLHRANLFPLLLTAVILVPVVVTALRRQNRYTLCGIASWPVLCGRVVRDDVLCLSPLPTYLQIVAKGRLRTFDTCNNMPTVTHVISIRLEQPLIRYTPQTVKATAKTSAACVCCDVFLWLRARAAHSNVCFVITSDDPCPMHEVDTLRKKQTLVSFKEGHTSPWHTTRHFR